MWYNISAVYSFVSQSTRAWRVKDGDGQTELLSQYCASIEMRRAVLLIAILLEYYEVKVQQLKNKL